VEDCAVVIDDKHSRPRSRMGRSQTSQSRVQGHSMVSPESAESTGIRAPAAPRGAPFAVATSQYRGCVTCTMTSEQTRRHAARTGMTDNRRDRVGARPSVWVGPDKIGVPWPDVLVDA
jgi:hypothetical protein